MESEHTWFHAAEGFALSLHMWQVAPESTIQLSRRPVLADSACRATNPTLSLSELLLTSFLVPAVFAWCLTLLVLSFSFVIFLCKCSAIRRM